MTAGSDGDDSDDKGDCGNCGNITVTVQETGGFCSVKLHNLLS